MTKRQLTGGDLTSRNVANVVASGQAALGGEIKKADICTLAEIGQMKCTKFLLIEYDGPSGSTVMPHTGSRTAEAALSWQCS